ncbi:hypothetical protein KFZ70_02805 [Tamlana fucoidanivorans]|uniref:Uncharacterized protein n=1 Tax=Allotamlana fucoidanivorans TaxID=2583814 RepID=A0A5C4SF22_9FLAO|nr:hypothetical protein [Tamlana fucoidanivorans]TNJ41910.1 hypothetical protein FGF67_15235 [Tamlana fucoidanivorans]
MQTRDYDCYILIEALKGFRLLNEDFTAVIPAQETNGYTNLYANSIAVSFLHDMEDEQLNAIHFFEDHQKTIIDTISAHLSKTFKDPKKELGLDCINILNEHKDGICYVAYRFLDASGNKFYVKLHKNKVINNRNFFLRFLNKIYNTIYS